MVLFIGNIVFIIFAPAWLEIMDILVIASNHLLVLVRGYLLSAVISTVPPMTGLLHHVILDCATLRVRLTQATVKLECDSVIHTRQEMSFTFNQICKIGNVPDI